MNSFAGIYIFLCSSNDNYINKTVLIRHEASLFITHMHDVCDISELSRSRTHAASNEWKSDIHSWQRAYDIQTMITSYVSEKQKFSTKRLFLQTKKIARSSSFIEFNVTCFLLFRFFPAPLFLCLLFCSMTMTFLCMWSKCVLPIIGFLTPSLVCACSFFVLFFLLMNNTTKSDVIYIRIWIMNRLDKIRVMHKHRDKRVCFFSRFSQYQG